ncbi:hypothetical protein CEP54_003581 [Fusarium duplospermum]|uniref:Zn(2)-C6 fungal-type domain-containing protein n=1 Tax=Fusarium duplospermum TaxID=1325734 RepID=A0A428QND3_9HYPO|nr:hypothetical protein CEP54_003581 [Fusarium duplospermum]
MNPHYPFKAKRPRPPPGVEDSAPSSISFTTPVDTNYTTLPYEIQQHLEQLSQFYGLTSGYQIHQILDQEYCRKRRRVDSSSFPMAPERGSTSSQGSLEKLPVSTTFDQNQEQYGSSSSWTDSASASGPSSTSPITRRIADLSLLLCPCCGYGLRQPDGYQQLSTTPAVVPDQSTPYVAEKQPSLQIIPPEPYSDTVLGLEAQSAFDYQQPDLASAPLTSFPLLPDQTTLAAPLISDAGPGQQPQLPAGDFYPNQPLKQEAQLESQPMMPAQHLMTQNLAQVGYGSDANLVSTAALPPHGLVTAEDISPYCMAPTGQLGGDAMQGGWPEVHLLDQQPNFEIILPNQRGGKRGPFKDPSLREQTAQTRKIGSCIRCRMQRIRCENNPDEEGGPCLTCKKVSNSRAGRFPCLRYKITDIRLFKPGQVPGYEWTRRWNNNISDPIQNWASDELKTIYISEGLSSKCVKIEVREFIPQTGDKLERTWDYKGTKRSVSIPPYALVNLEEVKEAYQDHIRDSMKDAFGRLLGPRNGLLFKTYERAWHIYQDQSTSPECHELLHQTLMLWMSVRLTTRSSFIVGNETLGMRRDILDETSPNHGMIPLPPVLGAQLDLILIHHIQTRLRRELLDKLQKMMSKNKQSTWLVTYLVVFILLHNTALITAHDAGYAKKHGMKRRFAREEKVKEYHLGANILLAHFHYCNKGIYPFSEDCKDQDLRTLAGLDEEKIKFVHTTTSYARRNRPEWEEIRQAGAYEHDYFFVSQLFEANWQPRTTI